MSEVKLSYVKNTIPGSGIILAFAAGLIITIGSTYPDKELPFAEKATCTLAGANTIFLQEKEKYQYVGMENCASKCHNNNEMGFQYEIVMNSPHAQAFRVLKSGKALHFAKKAGVEEDPPNSKACLRCHVTGAGLDSASLTATYKIEDGVTCEACHKAEFITKTFIPSEQVCLKCHNNSVHRVHRFDFGTYCTKIAHPRPKSPEVSTGQ